MKALLFVAGVPLLAGLLVLGGGAIALGIGWQALGALLGLAVALAVIVAGAFLAQVWKRRQEEAGQ